MTYTDEEILNLRYNINLNKIEVEKRKWTSRLLRTIKKNKIISFSVISYIVLSGINCVFIYNLIKVFEEL